MWFTEEASAFIGSCMGAGVGLMGAALGVFAVARGLKEKKYRKPLLMALRFFISLGAILLAVGLFALAVGQPYHVWYPFILIGATLVLVCIPNYFVVMKVIANMGLGEMDIQDMLNRS